MREYMERSFFEKVIDKSPMELFFLILRLEVALMCDELTQVFNRRYINKQLPVEMLHSTDVDKPVFLAIADIDNFKKVNDRYGHIAGDRILQQFAMLLTQVTCNEEDWVARYGGDEFLICLHVVSEEKALAAMHRVQRSIEDTKFIIPQGFIHITCSMGICVLQNDMDMRQWIDYADKKLYKAKARERFYVRSKQKKGLC